jgi:hypothetical protein
MENVKKAPTNKNEAVPVEQPQVPNHTETIKSQVLARTGKPPRLDRVEVSQHHHGNYRVNIWQQPVPHGEFAVIIAPRILSSYYLKVSDTGEIIHSNPPLTKLRSLA